MELTKFTENLNNIQALPDKPALSADDLKMEFDKAGNKIKDYINNTLITEMLEILETLEENINEGENATTAINNTITTMKAKLDGIANGANNYVHPTSTGNKHIPSGGSSGQILRWASDGTATWGADNNTTYGVATTAINGLMSASDKVKLNGIASGANNYVHPTSAGNKHIPSGGSSGQILRWGSAGTAVWGADNNTTYGVATTSTNGLMSAGDKAKLDGIATGANKTTVENVLTSTSTSNALSAAQGKTLKGLVDGKQKIITTGTATPTGGSSGDIYIQYF